MDFKRGTFRVRGENLEIFPASYTDSAIRVDFLMMKSREFQRLML